MARNIQSHEKPGPTAKIALPEKILFTIIGQIKSFPEKKKLKEFIITKPLLYEMLRELFKKKKKIKTMNNKMAKENTYLSIIESQKQTKQTRRIETESWIWRAF